MPGSTTISTFPQSGGDPIMGDKFSPWWGTDDRDGTASPWNEAPWGTIYLYMNGSTPKLYIKDADTNADGTGHNDDWGVIAFTT